VQPERVPEERADLLRLRGEHNGVQAGEHAGTLAPGLVVPARPPRDGL
jgi:hypothetical protein